MEQLESLPGEKEAFIALEAASATPEGIPYRRLANISLYGEEGKLADLFLIEKNGPYIAVGIAPNAEYVNQKFRGKYVRVGPIIEYSLEYPYGRAAVVWLRSQKAFYKVTSVAPSFTPLWKALQDSANITGHVINALINLGNNKKISAALKEVAKMSNLSIKKVIEKITNNRQFILRAIVAQKKRNLLKVDFVVALCSNQKWRKAMNNINLSTDAGLVGPSFLLCEESHQSPLDGDKLKVCDNFSDETEEYASKHMEESEDDSQEKDINVDGRYKGATTNFPQSTSQRSLRFPKKLVNLDSTSEYNQIQKAACLDRKRFKTTVARPRNQSILPVFLRKYALPSIQDDQFPCPVCGIFLYRSSDVNVVSRLLSHMEAIHPTKENMITCADSESLKALGQVSAPAALTMLEWPKNSWLDNYQVKDDIFNVPLSSSTIRDQFNYFETTRPRPATLTEHLNQQPQLSTLETCSPSTQGEELEDPKTSIVIDMVCDKEHSQVGLPENAPSQPNLTLASPQKTQVSVTQASAPASGKSTLKKLADLVRNKLTALRTQLSVTPRSPSQISSVRSRPIESPKITVLDLEFESPSQAPNNVVQPNGEFELFETRQVADEISSRQPFTSTEQDEPPASTPVMRIATSKLDVVATCPSELAQSYYCSLSPAFNSPLDKFRKGSCHLSVIGSGLQISAHSPDEPERLAVDGCRQLESQIIELTAPCESKEFIAKDDSCSSPSKVHIERVVSSVCSSLNEKATTNDLEIAPKTSEDNTEVRSSMVLPKPYWNPWIGIVSAQSSCIAEEPINDEIDGDKSVLKKRPRTDMGISIVQDYYRAASSMPIEIIDQTQKDFLAVSWLVRASKYEGSESHKSTSNHDSITSPIHEECQKLEYNAEKPEELKNSQELTLSSPEGTVKDIEKTLVDKMEIKPYDGLENTQTNQPAAIEN